MTEPTDAELRALLPTKLLERDMPPKVQVWLTQKDALAFARAVLAKRGTPAGAGEVVALSEDQIIDLFNDACRETFNGLERFRYFARAIEAEVRKQDEALIQQLVEALEGCTKHDDADYAALAAGRAALAAGRARLEGKP